MGYIPGIRSAVLVVSNPKGIFYNIQHCVQSAANQKILTVIGVVELGVDEMKGDIEVGDTIIIAEKAFEVTAVGDEAQKTFKELGHATINFAGRDVPDLPGHIMLKGDEALTEDDIVKGAKIEIY